MWVEPRAEWRASYTTVVGPEQIGLDHLRKRSEVEHRNEVRSGEVILEQYLIPLGPLAD